MKMNLLLVEDDPAQATYIEAMALQLGHRPLVANALQGALDALMTQHIDGAICDLVLDSGSGLDVAQACEAHGVPVVFVTASCDEYNINRMYQYGFVISKPLRMNALACAIEHFALCRKHRQARN